MWGESQQRRTSTDCPLPSPLTDGLWHDVSTSSDEVMEVEAVSVPALEPLFEFSPEMDLSFGFSTNDTRPFVVMGE